MKKVLRQCAEILVDCEYADRQGDEDKRQICYYRYDIFRKVLANPFSDTLEGRRQADAIEDWLREYRFNLWIGARADGKVDRSAHQWRLDRIKWCIQELIK